MLYGKIEKTAGGGGEGGADGQESYSVTRTERGYYWIELVSGQQTVIPVGGTTQFIAKSNSNPTGEISLWTIQKDGSGGNLYSGGAAVQITTPSNLEAAKYSVEGTAVASPNPISGTEIAVVGVQNLSSGEVISPNASGEVQTLYIPVGKATDTITITATPEPGKNWPAGYPTWKVNNLSSGTAGSSTFSLSAAIAGEYTIAATCGTSTKTMKITVWEIKSETIATSPADRTRKKIGIGEEVMLFTNPAISAEWCVTEGGTITSITGKYTKFTAIKKASTSKINAKIGKHHCSLTF